MRGCDDDPESVYDSNEYDNSEYLPHELRDGDLGFIDVAAGYRGLVGEGGAIARRRTDEQRRVSGACGIVVGRGRVVWRGVLGVMVVMGMVMVLVYGGRWGCCDLEALY